MKFDTVIIGGGLSGLIAGIELEKAGCSTAVITCGQSALNFVSGSLGFLSRCNGREVSDPVEALSGLPQSHPYSKIGAGRAAELAASVPRLLSEAGLSFSGSHRKNHYRLTPVGLFKPAWLSASDCAVADCATPGDWGVTAIVNIKGFLDFYPGFLVSNLTKAGVKCKVAYVSTPEFDRMRKNSTEMRAPGIAKALKGDLFTSFAVSLADAVQDADTVIMPAVVGLDGNSQINELRKMLGRNVMTVPAQPASVAGMRVQILLRRYYERLGGTYLLGDNVTAGYMEGGAISSLDTANLGKSGISGRYYVLATGGFFSRGLVAAPDRIYEPVFGLDVDAPSDRGGWYSRNIFDDQPYMSYGVTTDNGFHVFIDGSPVENMLAVGAVLGGCNSLKEGSGAGVAILTAMEVAGRIVSACKAGPNN